MVFTGIAVGGEEAKKPEKSIPIATGVAMAIVTTLYVGTSAALTLMVPYQNVDVAAPFPTAFAQRGLHWAKVIIAVGEIFYWNSIKSCLTPMFKSSTLPGVKIASIAHMS